MPTQKKIDTAIKLSEKITRAKSIILADYRRLKHKQLEELRKNLKKTQGEFVVAKNRLFLRALGDGGQRLKNSLTDTTAILFSFADEVAPLAELMKFFKSAGMGKTKGGLLGNHVLMEADVTRLASLPSRNVLLAKLAGQLNSPIQGLHYALSWNINKLVWALDAMKNKRQAIKN